MQRNPLTLTVSLAAFALVALTGCSSGGDDQAAETTAPATQVVTDQTQEETPQDEAPTLDGEGIAYGTETVTGLDFNTSCVGSGETVTVAGLATAEDGTQYTISVTEGIFGFTALSSDHTTTAIALAAGTSTPGTHIDVTENGSEYTITGTGTLTSTDDPTGSNVPFTARVTCDTTV